MVRYRFNDDNDLDFYVAFNIIYIEVMSRRWKGDNNGLYEMKHRKVMS